MLFHPYHLDHLPPVVDRLWEDVDDDAPIAPPLRRAIPSDTSA